MSVESAEKLKAENYEKILEVAYTLFSDNPIKKITLVNIAEKAGVTKQTVINLFCTKTNLLIMTIIAYYEKFDGILEQLKMNDEFQKLSGLDQIMEILYLRAKILYQKPFVASLIRELEEIQLERDCEKNNFEKYLNSTSKIIYTIRESLDKGFRDGSIKPELETTEAEEFLFFTYGTVIHRLVLMDANENLRNHIDLKKIMRNNLYLIKKNLINTNIKDSF